MVDYKSNPNTYSYLAFDIHPMSSPSRFEGVKLAVAMIDQNGETREWTNVSRKKLLLIIRKLSPKYVGTDNPTEVLNPKESISSFCSRLPDTTDFVHVNLTEHGNATPLIDLLYNNNIIKQKKKINPEETALYLIKLMEQGIGMVLEPFENETFIEIGRPRRRGKGGWSQSRYERQGEEIVYRASNNLQEILNRNNLKFDLMIKETKYGAKQAKFHLFDSKENILSNIKVSSLYPAKIKIWSPRKSVVTYRSIKKRKKEIFDNIYSNHKRLIIGIDPGITTGIAIVNLQGKILSIYSRKNLSKGDFVANLGKFGSPVAICADVSPPPQFVSKIAATYNAQIFSPKSQLSQFDKRELVRKWVPTQKMNSHERDALSAVINTYNRFDPLFVKIDKKDFTFSEKELAKTLIIRGLSISDSCTAIEILRKPKHHKEEFVKEQTENHESIIGRLYNLLGDFAHSEETISNIRAHTSNLELIIQNQKNQLKKLKKKISNSDDKLTLNLLKSEIIEEKENRIKHLTTRFQKELTTNKKLIERIRDLEWLLWSTLDDDNYPIKVLPRFSKEAIYRLEREMNIHHDDILLIVDPTGGSHQTAYQLAKTKFKMIFVENKKLPDEAVDILLDKGIPIVSSKDYIVKRVNQYAIISEKELTKALINFDKEFRQMKDKRRSRKINLAIKNYHYDREKQLIGDTVNYDNYEISEDEERAPVD
ncbi:MAG: hypothetical protein HeimC2_01880 [Candidatus Heimdallarchaeota archaeon LC_2]|nr:MAG: hypothetical protein HeimC2_01880 [Candidatus Heimdallarchaeota archaeon LC_2]